MKKSLFTFVVIILFTSCIKSSVFFQDESCLWEEKSNNTVQVAQGKELFEDLGAQEVYLSDTNMYYFSVERYRKNRLFCHRKWLRCFNQNIYSQFAEMIPVDFSEYSWTGLLRLPENIKYMDNKLFYDKLVVCFSDPETPIPLDPQMIVMFLERGFDVLAVPTSVQDFTQTSRSIAKVQNVQAWILDKLTYTNTVYYGKSLGSNLALIAGVEQPHSAVIIDRGFGKIQYVYESIAEYFPNVSHKIDAFISEKTYNLPRKEWIQKLGQNLLMIESLEDDSCYDTKNVLYAPGGHKSSYFGGFGNTWYSDSKSQESLQIFLYKTFTKNL